MMTRSRTKSYTCAGQRAGVLVPRGPGRRATGARSYIASRAKAGCGDYYTGVRRPKLRAITDKLRRAPVQTAHNTCAPRPSSSSRRLGVPCSPPRRLLASPVHFPVLFRCRSAATLLCRVLQPQLFGATAPDKPYFSCCLMCFGCCVPVRHWRRPIRLECSAPRRRTLMVESREADTRPISGIHDICWWVRKVHTQKGLGGAAMSMRSGGPLQQ